MRLRPLYLYLPLAIGACIHLAACSRDAITTDPGPVDTRPSVTSDAVRAQHIVMAHAVYSDALVAAQNLQSAIDRFLATPNETQLAEAKAAYKTLRAPYQQSEILRWDTDITLATNTGNQGIASVDNWEGQVNAWPLDESLIDYVSDGQGGLKPGFMIGGQHEISAEQLIAANGASINGLTGDEAEANVATGIHAIEFLLWGQDLNGTGPGAGQRPATDYDLAQCSHDHCDRRRQYLKVVTDLLVSDLTEMVAEWRPEAVKSNGTLAFNFFHSSQGVDQILLAINNLATDELASARMGSGLELLDTEEEHDCFSDLSHVAIYHNFQGVKNAFYGHYISPLDGRKLQGASLGDLIKQLDPATFNAIDQKLVAIEAQMAELLALGEANPPLRFDQIIGEGKLTPQGPHYVKANQTSLDLIALRSDLEQARLLLGLSGLGGSGDGD
jgi:putative iron-regulated protein